MARDEITGRAPRVTQGEAQRKKVLPRAGVVIVDDPDAFEPAPHDERITALDVKQTPTRGPPTRAAFTIPEFCLAHDLSQAFYYKLKAQGLGPIEMKVGSRRLISFEAAAAWRRAREAASA